MLAGVTLHPANRHTDEHHVGAGVGHRRALPALGAVVLVAASLSADPSPLGVGDAIPRVAVVVGHTVVLGFLGAIGLHPVVRFDTFVHDGRKRQRLAVHLEGAPVELTEDCAGL